MKIQIGNKSVRFEANALFPVKYKALTGRDIFKDMKEIEKLANITAETMDQFNIDVLFDIAYTLAWFADRSIPERDEWLLSFDEFNIYEVLPQITGLLADSLATKKNIPVASPQKKKKKKQKN